MDLLVHIRRPTSADIDGCARVIYDAFKGIADLHGFPPDFHSVQATTRVASFFIDHPAIFSVIAEVEGRVVGTSFLDERDAIHGVGGVAVDPPFQGRGIGRRLMEAVLARGRGAVGIRLVQEAYNISSMSLYAALGFEIKEPLVSLRGKPRSHLAAKSEVRPMRRADLKACAALCQSVHGCERTHELRDALHAPPACSAFVSLRQGRIVAYTYKVFRNLAHGVAETETDMRALILGVGAMSSEPFAFFLPTRQASLFRWCLSEGLRVVKPATLMAIGAYQEPRGCYFPSGLY
jgi:GNAT superfamily N-acetyltransferase